jgi:enoyl-CoA hydratase
MTIHYKISDGIGQITLDRPEKAHAYDSDHLTQILDAFSSLSKACSVIVIHSTGEGVFSAGADLDEMKHATAEDAANLRSQAIFTEIARANVVTIAVIYGAAVAGGFELALACDLRVAGRNAFFRLPETSLGIIPAAGGTTRLTTLLGAAVAKNVILAGQDIDAESAIRWGLAIDGGETPFDAAMKLAESVRDRDPVAQQKAKQLIDTVAEDVHLSTERTIQSELYARKNSKQH